MKRFLMISLLMGTITASQSVCGVNVTQPGESTDMQRESTNVQVHQTTLESTWKTRVLTTLKLAAAFGVAIVVAPYLVRWVVAPLINHVCSLGHIDLLGDFAKPPQGMVRLCKKHSCVDIPEILYNRSITI